jgi:hypothetical protein
MRVSKFIALLLIVVSASLPAFTQSSLSKPASDLSKPAAETAGQGWEMKKEMETRYFRLQVSVRELDGERVINHREFNVTVATEEHALRPVSIRSGDRIPSMVASKGAPETEYLDLGIDFDVQNVEMHGDRLALRIDGHLTSLADPANTNPAALVIRSNSWGSRVLLHVGKPEIVFSSDDASSTHRFQVEITATEIT